MKDMLVELVLYKDKVGPVHPLKVVDKYFLEGVECVRIVKEGTITFYMLDGSMHQVNLNKVEEVTINA